MCLEWERRTQNFLGKPPGERPLGNQKRVERIALKWFFGRWVVILGGRVIC
jgi:hypothetical protein